MVCVCWCVSVGVSDAIALYCVCMCSSALTALLNVTQTLLELGVCTADPAQAEAYLSQAKAAFDTRPHLGSVWEWRRLDNALDRVRAALSLQAAK